MMWDRLKLTFLDKDGSYAIPEIAATSAAASTLLASLLAIAMFVHKGWGQNMTPDYTGLGVAVSALTAGIGAIVFALGVAQRIRDGLWKKDDQ